MAMGACPGQIPMPCVPPALMVTATMVRACRYKYCRYKSTTATMTTAVDDSVDYQNYLRTILQAWYPL